MPCSRYLRLSVLRSFGPSARPQKNFVDTTYFTRGQASYHALLGRAYEALNRRSLHHQSVGEMYAIFGAYGPAIQQLELARRANHGCDGAHVQPFRIGDHHAARKGRRRSRA